MQSYNVIGVMSGTSLDGLDIVFCNLSFTDSWSFKILKSKTLNYDPEWKEKLSNAHNLSGFDLQKLHKEYGSFIGESINSFINDIDQKINLIASHGHTVFHQPESKITLQIGDGTEIAVITGITTISDFRSLDVALGGQGAPLVPIGDELLFSEYDFCINLGGFSNISFKENNIRVAYDICPANIILNYLANKLGKAYDKNGTLGKDGNINIDLLKKLNNLEYYHLTHPKSLGREWLDEVFLPIIEQSKISIYDQIRTVYEHIAYQISLSLNTSKKSKTLITGGGAYNNFLIEQIKQKTKSKIIIPDKEIIEFKEALIFALLGVLRFNNQINCLSSVTGAKRDSSGGIIHLL